MIQISSDDLYMLTVSAVRYAIGRQTYVVGEACDFLRRYAKYFTPEQRAVVVRDIGTALDEAQKIGHTVGSVGDHADWVSVLGDMEKMG